MIWKTYKYLYYRLYIWYRKKFGDEDIPQFSGVVIMSLSFGCNVLSIVVLLDIMFGIQIFPNGVPKSQAILFAIGILLGHYFAFMHNGKFRKIEKEFKKEIKVEKKWKKWWVLLYVLGSPIFYIFLLFFGIWLKH